MNIFPTPRMHSYMRQLTSFPGPVRQAFSPQSQSQNVRYGTWQNPVIQQMPQYVEQSASCGKCGRAGHAHPQYCPAINKQCVLTVQNTDILLQFAELRQGQRRGQKILLWATLVIMPDGVLSPRPTTGENHVGRQR